jgi:asparagine synthase (glutamine-hydrolysing)
MRRALRGLVPESILNRKRKAFVARGPASAVLEEKESIGHLTENMLAEVMGIVDVGHLKEVLGEGGDCRTIPVLQLVRTFELEVWLRHAVPQFISCLQIGPSGGPRRFASMTAA